MKRVLILTLLALPLFLSPPVWAGSAFVDHGDQTVTDGSTGLRWDQRETTTMDWAAALSYCEGSTHAGFTDWRLPNRNELESLVDRSKSAAPFINTDYFSSAVSDFYWTSTSYTPNYSLAWAVDFSKGWVDNETKTLTHYVRCVR